MMDIVQLHPDSAGYIGFAEIMMRSFDWLHTADLTDYQDVIHHRLPFYPFLIAVGQTFFGKSGGLVFIVMLQFALFGFSLQRFFSFMGKLNFSTITSSCVTLALAIGIPLFFTCSILTDSFYLSFGLLALTSTTLLFLDKATSTDKITIAVSFVFMTLLRESTLYFALAFTPFLFFMLINKNKRNTLILAGLIFIPILAVNALLSTWNFYRTNQAFVTTGLTTALVNPILDLKNKYPKLDYVSPLDRYLPSTRPYQFADGLRAAEHLSIEQKLDMPQLEKIIKATYFNSWSDFTLQRIIISFDNALKGKPNDVFNPMRNIQLFYEHGQTQKVPRFSDLKNLNFEDGTAWGEISYVLATAFFRLLSLVLVLFGLYKLYLRLKTPGREMIDWAYLCLALQAFIWWGINAAVHVEPRYIMTSYAVFALLALAPRKKVLAGEKSK